MVDDSTKEELCLLRKSASLRTRNEIRTNALVKFKPEVLETVDGFENEILKELTFVFLGEIPNMPGHCVVAGSSGRVHFGLHTGDFVELTEDEV